MAIRRKLIRKIVEDVLKKTGITQPPVSVETIAKQINLRVRFEPFDGNLSGCIVRQGGEVTIGINSFHHKNRQRFTLAHEIGHFFLHKGEEIIVDRSFRVNLRDSEAAKAESPEEIEANYFAAELLMPTKFLLKDLDGKAIDIESDEDIRELSSRYHVSSQALSYRLTNLGYLHR
jgi:Zn-dependent peptidase ImmA (M78 family)